MRTLVLERPGSWRMAETAEPASPGAGEAVVRVRRVGVCGTDIHAFKGEQPFFEYPRILGHELGVEIEAVGEGVTGVSVGDRCAVEPYLNCGVCRVCRLGRTNCCVELKCLGVHTDGGMRDRIVLPASKLHVSRSLGLDALALVETLGIGKHAVSRAAVGEGESVAVVGLGPIGLTAALFAKLAGADVVGLDVSAERAQAAERLLGIRTLVIDPSAPAAEQWQAKFGELPFKVLDATGHRGSMQGSFGLTGQGGTLTFVGLLLGEIGFDDPEFHRKEMTLLASRNSVAADFREIIEHLEAGRIDVEAWVTHRASVAGFVDVFEDWLRPGAGLLKGVVSFDD
ncbi:zinc-binding alcohol dehydrogenase family protein [Mucisphaera sp.]|uniref:zinc-binding alcohol dehydrogenase family protein n=1 Tax=Mucisphaera sp. TaxID=2913024 RepID=UPI003D09BA3F